MSERQEYGRVENYTTAFLVTMAGLTFMTLWTVASVAGTGWMLATAGGFELAIRWLRR